MINRNFDFQKSVRWVMQYTHDNNIPGIAIVGDLLVGRIQLNDATTIESEINADSLNSLADFSRST